jgi:transcriptional regulator with XRE-family HTH domain
MSYKLDFQSASSAEIERALCERLEAIRLARNLTQAQLADEAGVSRRTLSRLAAGAGVTLDTFVRVMAALGIQQNLQVLLPDPSVRPMERATGRGRERRRARPKSTDAAAEPWAWADEGENDSEGPQHE